MSTSTKTVNTVLVDYEAAKAAILAGQIYYGWRRNSGRTTALCDAIHEKHQGEAWVVLPNQRLAHFFLMHYRMLYPGETEPHVISGHQILRGTGVSVYVDNYDMFTSEQCENVAHAIIGGIA